MPLSKEKQKQWMEEYRQRKDSVIPNQYLAAHLKCCPGYDTEHPGDHFDHCPFIDPTLRNVSVIPKYAVGYLYPDGRTRLEDMTVVQPEQCGSVKLW